MHAARERLRRWRRPLARVLAGAALAGMIAVAAAALLLPPPAQAEVPHGAHRPPAAGSMSARDGPLDVRLPVSSAPARPMAPMSPPVAVDAQARCTAPGLTGQLNLNTATKEQLERLPGIGPAKAQRILEWRTRHGTFRRVRDLRRVKGFGRKTLLRLLPYLSVEGQTTLEEVGRR